MLRPLFTHSFLVPLLLVLDLLCLCCGGKRTHAQEVREADRWTHRKERQRESHQREEEKRHRKKEGKKEDWRNRRSPIDTQLGAYHGGVGGWQKVDAQASMLMHKSNTTTDMAGA